MKIKLLKPVIVKGCDGAKVGDILDVPPGVASFLVSDNNAEFYEDKKLEPEIIHTREPRVVNRDPLPFAETQPEKPARRRSSK
jgi:hypothetical protein